MGLVGRPQNPTISPRDEKRQPTVIGLRDHQRRARLKWKLQDEVNPFAVPDAERHVSAQAGDGFRPDPGRVDHMASADVDLAATQAVANGHGRRGSRVDCDDLSVVQEQRPGLSRGPQDGIGQADVVGLRVVVPVRGRQPVGPNAGDLREEHFRGYSGMPEIC